MKSIILRRKGMVASAVALTSAAVLIVGGIAYADIIKDSIDSSGGITLVAGSSTGGTAQIFVNSGVTSAGDTVDGCNVSTDAPLVLHIVTPTGVTASPNPLTLSDCNPTKYTVTFTAGSTAVSGHASATIVSAPAGGFDNTVDIPITVTGGTVTPTNTAPTVTVTGVTDGAQYEIGSVPAAGCSVVDEDANASATPVPTGSLLHGLGFQTVTCSYTDSGGLTGTATATYEIVDTTNPTITHSLDPAAPNTNQWYKTDVTVTFSCADTDGSGIQSCTGDTTLTEGADQSVTGTATDWAGNTATDEVTGISIDETAPTVSWTGGPTGTIYYGDTFSAPTCDAVDLLSGPDTCTVSGGGTTVGPHTYTATATDRAGNQGTDTFNYSISPWKLDGFYQPVDMSGIWNTVKNGSTVPLKFNVYKGSTELTDTAVVTSFTQKQVTCPGAGAVTDAVEITTTGGTSLRYDATGHQFVQNWATPKKAGTCWTTTMTTQDGSHISADFQLK